VTTSHDGPRFEPGPPDLEIASESVADAQLTRRLDLGRRVLAVSLAALALLAGWYLYEDGIGLADLALSVALVSMALALYVIYATSVSLTRNRLEREGSIRRIAASTASFARRNTASRSSEATGAPEGAEIIVVMPFVRGVEGRPCTGPTILLVPLISVPGTYESADLDYFRRLLCGAEAVAWHRWWPENDLLYHAGLQRAALGFLRVLAELEDDDDLMAPAIHHAKRFLREHGDGGDAEDSEAPTA